MSIITILTDFDSTYAAAMKGVILGRIPDVVIVDISLSILPQDVRSAAFALYINVPYFPDGTLHLAVVDPGVGTMRQALVICAAGQYFVGPDNGILIPAVRRLGGEDIEVFEIVGMNAESATFHGRDIFAPVAAQIVAQINANGGIDAAVAGTLSVIGHMKRIKDYVTLDFGDVAEHAGVIEGHVIYVDCFGNIITNIAKDILMEYVGFGNQLRVFGRDVPFVESYGFVETGKLLVTIGSHGFVEISINCGDAASMFGVVNGQVILVMVRE